MADVIGGSGRPTLPVHDITRKHSHLSSAEEANAGLVVPDQLGFITNPRKGSNIGFPLLLEKVPGHKLPKKITEDEEFQWN